MGRKGKKRADEDPADSDSPRPSKKPARSASAGDDEDILVCKISKNRRVAVRSWQGKVVVDIREFYEKDGEQLPGKKGILLPADQWKILRDHVEEIDRAVKENE